MWGLNELRDNAKKKEINLQFGGDNVKNRTDSVHNSCFPPSDSRKQPYNFCRLL